MTKAEFQRELKRAELDGWNRGIRAAIKMIREMPYIHDVHSAASVLSVKLRLGEKIKPLKRK